MNRKFLFFIILIICENLINSDFEDCSAFSCSLLSAGNDDQICLFSSNGCKPYFTSCSKLPTADCIKETIISDLKSKCEMDGTTCSLKDRPCSEYSYVSSYGVECHSLKATSPLKCYLDATDNENPCKPEGCIGDSEGDCKSHKPITDNGNINSLKICHWTGTSCIEKDRECSDYENTGADCYKLKATSPLKCYLDANDNENPCKPEGCIGDSEGDCKSHKPITDNGQVDESQKCDFKNGKCSAIIKECTEMSKDFCSNHVLADPKKQCYVKDNNCKEQYKTCKDYNDIAQAQRDKDDCEDIIIEGSFKCKFNSKNICEIPKCEDRDANTCNLIGPDDTHKCEYIDEKCIEVEIYKTCSLYKGNDRRICELIKPSESNMKCIFKEDSECALVQKECEEYIGAVLNEYECINNYKPLDDNLKCSFISNKCESQPKYCSYYKGTTPAECESIIPINKGEKYSIKCSYDTTMNKCIRKPKSCDDVGTEQECPLIIPEDSTKKCIYKNSKCIEEYKTCDEYNNDQNVDTIDKDTCEGITSIDGKICKYEVGTTTKHICKGETQVCNNDLDLTSFPTLCESIPLKNTWQKCKYEVGVGVCKKIDKNCKDIVFNQNENNKKEICKSAPVEVDNNVCIIRPDNSGCIEIDSSMAPKEESSSDGNSQNNPTTSSKSNSQNPSNNNKNGQGQQGQQGQTNAGTQQDDNSGKKIYLNKLLIIILCLLF